MRWMVLAAVLLLGADAANAGVIRAIGKAAAVTAKAVSAEAVKAGKQVWKVVY